MGRDLEFFLALHAKALVVVTARSRHSRAGCEHGSRLRPAHGTTLTSLSGHKYISRAVALQTASHAMAKRMPKPGSMPLAVPFVGHPDCVLSDWQVAEVKDHHFEVHKAHADHLGFLRAALAALSGQPDPACAKISKSIDSPDHLLRLVHATMRQNATIKLRSLGGTANSVVQGVLSRFRCPPPHSCQRSLSSRRTATSTLMQQHTCVRWRRACNR